MYKTLWMRIFECGTNTHLPFASRDGKSLVEKVAWLCGGIIWCEVDFSTQKSVHFGTVIHTWHGMVFIKCNSIFPVNWKGLNKKLWRLFLGSTSVFIYRYWGIPQYTTVILQGWLRKYAERFFVVVMAILLITSVGTLMNIHCYCESFLILCGKMMLMYSHTL